MTLYETIFTRRAVRKYEPVPLDDKTLAEIQDFLNQAEQMQGQKATFEIVSADAVKGAQAPHYILAYCDANDAAYANVGYVLSKCDLYIQSIGLGSVFLGMAKPVQKRDDYCIMLAFGKSGAPFRSGEKDFDRLPLAEICGTDNSITRAARLAPSAINSQPWKIDLNDGIIRVSYHGRGLTKMVLKKVMNKVDVGIVSRHIAVTLQNEGKEIISATPQISGKDFFVEIICV